MTRGTGLGGQVRSAGLRVAEPYGANVIDPVHPPPADERRQAFAATASAVGVPASVAGFLSGAV